MKTKKQIATETANKEGYDSARYICKWRKYTVFSAFDNDWKENPPFIGLPVYILVDDNLAGRFAIAKESQSIFDVL
jgi:hypothetical protein